MRVYNFSAGPSVLPEEVLTEVQSEMLDYHGSGMSVTEMSHRGKWFSEIAASAEQGLRDLLNIGDDYHVIFVQGGASTQFEAVPLNLLGKNNKADYVVTGNFAKKAFKEAGKYGDIRLAASSEEAKFTYIPKLTAKDFRQDAEYVHITSNNTIFGTHYTKLPDTGGIKLVADMSSDILSKEIDVHDYAVIYAGAQKISRLQALLLLLQEKTLWTTISLFLIVPQC